MGKTDVGNFDSDLEEVERENLNSPGIEVVRKVATWKQRLGTTDETESREAPRFPKPCPHCKLEIKVGLTDPAVGALYHRAFPSAGVQPRDSRSATSPNIPDRAIYTPPSMAWPIPGMAVAASPDAPRRYSVIPTSTSFPVQKIRWEAGLVCLTEGAEYLALCRRSGEFSIENMQKIMDAGANLVKAAGGLANAARQFQFLRFRELRYVREFIERTQHLYPDTAEDAMSIFTRCAAPMYEALPTKKRTWRRISA